MRTLIVGIIALLFSANLAWADIVATWTFSDGAVTKLRMRDDQHVRIDTNERDTYMLLTNQPKSIHGAQGKGEMVGFRHGPDVRNHAALCDQKEKDDYLTDTTDKATDAAKDQTQDSIVEGVREGVKSIFKKVW
jgi:hypothetical protein